MKHHSHFYPELARIKPVTKECSRNKDEFQRLVIKMGILVNKKKKTTT